MTQRGTNTAGIGDIAEWLACVALTEAGWRCRRVEGLPYDIIAHYSPGGYYRLQVKAVTVRLDTHTVRGRDYCYQRPVINTRPGTNNVRRYGYDDFDFYLAVLWNRDDVFAGEPEFWMIPIALAHTRRSVTLNSRKWKPCKVTRAMLRARCEF